MSLLSLVGADLSLPLATKRTKVKVSKPVEAKWTINGFPATVTIYTRTQWLGLRVKPEGVQELENGDFATLRMD